MTGNSNRVDLDRFVQEAVYPALYHRLASAFPEFAWRQSGNRYVADRWPAQFPMAVEHENGARLMVYEDAPWAVKVHGYGAIRWLDYLNGGSVPRGQSYMDCVAQLADRAGVAMPAQHTTPEQIEAAEKRDVRRAVLGRVVDICRGALRDSEWAADARAYLDGRGLDAAAQDELHLGIYPSVRSVHDILAADGFAVGDRAAENGVWAALEGYAIFPWLDATGQPLTLYGRWPSGGDLPLMKNLHGWTHRRAKLRETWERQDEDERGEWTEPQIPKTVALFGTGTKDAPLYFDRAWSSGARDLVLVEGVIDAACLHVGGDARAIACVAAQLSRGQTETIARYKPRSVTICLDSDRGGAKGTLSCIRQLTEVGIEAYVAKRLPPGQDPNDFVRAQGMDAWRAHVADTVHGLRFMARHVVEAAKPGGGKWTDRAKVEALKAAEEFATKIAGPRVKEGIESFFWPEFDSLVPGVKRDKRKGRKKEKATVPTPPPIGVQEDPALIRHELTDLGNAERIVSRHGEDLRYCKAFGWMVWDGSRWAMDETEGVKRRARDTVKLIRAEGDTGGEKWQAAVDKWAHASQARAKIEAMVALAQHDEAIAVPQTSFDRDPWLLAAANGTVDLRNGELSPPDRGLLNTKVCGASYDPGGDVRQMAPRWLAFLEEVQPDHEIRQFLQRLAGSSACGQVRDHVFPVNYGTGRNGKGVFAEVLIGALGDYASIVPASLLMASHNDKHPADKVTLRGLRLAMASETDEDKKLDVATVKELTGGDTIMARYMRRDFFSFKPSHTLILATNNKPRINETTDAIWDRVLLIPWAVKVPEDKQEKGLADRIIANERDGVLKWIVDGCIAWQEEGLDPPDSIRAATKAYRGGEDHIGTFIDETCDIASGAFVAVREVQRLYNDWCSDNGILHPIGPHRFRARMETAGFVKEKHRINGGSPVWCWVGLTIKPPSFDDIAPPHWSSR